MKRKKRGFTIIELLIGLGIAAVITGAAMGLYMTANKQLMVQNSVTDAQASLRAASVEMVSKIMMAGYKVPEVCTPIVASNTNPDTISITYDTGETGDIQIEHEMPEPSAELRCDGHDLAGLYDNDWIYIYDPFAKVGEFFVATNVQYASSHIQHNTMPLSRRYPAGSKILKIQRAKFFIDSRDANHPNLMKAVDAGAPVVYAENITNLNLQYALASGAIVDVPTISKTVREVIITLDARTDKPDREFQTEYRTRSITTRAKVRNLAR